MRILIVDDDPQILEALSLGIQVRWSGAEIVTAADGNSALSVFRSRNPEVVLLDLGLPFRSGLDVLREIRAASDIPVIILTAKGDEADQVRGLELGADEYLVKPVGALAIIARIRAVMRRYDQIQSQRKDADFISGDLAIDFAEGSATLAGKPLRLTPIEYRLLSILARNRGEVVTHDTLISKLWGDDYGATTAHLKVFVSRLRTKIEGDGGPRRIETERGIGYRFIVEGPPPGGRPSVPRPRSGVQADRHGRATR